MNAKTRAKNILTILQKTYPQVGPFIHYSTPLELLVGTILSAQCTDERVNMVTKTLFAKYKSARDYADADLATLEKDIYSTGFYKNKAKALKESGRIMVENFGGQVPDTLDDLLTLRGVSHKTAYLVLAKVYGKNVGIAVDTHVFRLSKRMGISDAKTPDSMRKELHDIIAPEDYLLWNEYLITHGRAVCGRKPQCHTCAVQKYCKKII